MADDTAVAWTDVSRGAPVLGADGAAFGHVDAVLGDASSDIFHGLAVNHSGVHLGTVEVLAQHIHKITEAQVETDLSQADVDALPTYKEERWYHANVSRLLKHASWRQ